MTPADLARIEQTLKEIRDAQNQYAKDLKEYLFDSRMVRNELHRQGREIEELTQRVIELENVSRRGDD
jgi:polyhydroxyalkanoate synthesis regulator phasin